MKAAVFREPGTPLTIETIADPTPAVGEAIIQVHHCGVCGTDLHSTEQQHEPGIDCVVLGHEFVGEIVELGKDTPAGWRKGDRLASLPFIGCGHCLACLKGTTWQCASRNTCACSSHPRPHQTNQS